MCTFTHALVRGHRHICADKKKWAGVLRYLQKLPGEQGYLLNILVSLPVVITTMHVSFVAFADSCE